MLTQLQLSQIGRSIVSVTSLTKTEPCKGEAALLPWTSGHGNAHAAVSDVGEGWVGGHHAGSSLCQLLLFDKQKLVTHEKPIDS